MASFDVVHMADSAGSVSFNGKDLSGVIASQRVLAGISQVPEGRQVFTPMTVEDNLKIGAFTRSKLEIAQGLLEMYELFPILRDKRSLPSGTLSGGQQQMFAMARGLMAKPMLLLLDEPSMGLAPLIIQEIFRLIQSLRQQGITILVVEQNARAALAIADHGYVMEQGRIVMIGPGAELLKDDRVRQVYLGMQACLASTAWRKGIGVNILFIDTKRNELSARCLHHRNIPAQKSTIKVMQLKILWYQCFSD
jgi:branched-chain amino acid transport system ATP-binding protein